MEFDDHYYAVKSPLNMKARDGFDWSTRKASPFVLKLGIRRLISHLMRSARSGARRHIRHTSTAPVATSSKLDILSHSTTIHSNKHNQHEKPSKRKRVITAIVWR